MNSFATQPPHFLWNAQQLADAVPLRLHQTFRFAAANRPAANAPQRRPHPAAGYLPAAAPLATFHIH